MLGALAFDPPADPTAPMTWQFWIVLVVDPAPVRRIFPAGR
jgi:hypothetical protein